MFVLVSCVVLNLRSFDSFICLVRKMLKSLSQSLKMTFSIVNQMMKKP